MSNRTKAIFIVAGILLVYGYLCRLVGIFFFWDSLTIAWIVGVLGLISYFFDLIKIRKEKDQKTIWLKVAIGFIIFMLALSTVTVIEIKNIKAYRVAIEYIKTDPAIENELGEIKGFGLIPTGSMSISTGSHGTSSGQANFSITVIGKKKIKNITVYLEKTPETDWTVISEQ